MDEQLLALIRGTVAEQAQIDSKRVLVEKVEDARRFHRLADCGKHDCDICVPEQVATTLARSPLAILTCGFDAVFKNQWGFVPADRFLPEGVSR